MLASRLGDRPALHAFAAYGLTTYAVSWTVWAVWATASDLPVLLDTVLFVLGAAGPSLVALAFVRAEGRSLRGWLASILRLRVGVRYYLLALALPFLIVLVAATVHVGWFGGTVTPDALASPEEYPVLLAFILLFGGGQEEPGWRGYALPRLQEEYGALGAALLIGVVWAGWHLPLFVVPGTIQSALAPWLYVPQVVALSVVLTWVTNATGGSVLPGMLLHAGANTVVNYYPPGGVVGAASPLGFGLLTATATGVALVLVWRYGPESLAPGDTRAGSTPAER